MKNILAFGDSIIKGISYQNNRYHQNPERFTALLEERWNIHIENKGQMGSTVLRLPKAVERSESYLKDIITPRLIQFNYSSADFAA